MDPTRLIFSLQWFTSRGMTLRTALSLCLEELHRSLLTISSHVALSPQEGINNEAKPSGLTRYFSAMRSIKLRGLREPLWDR